MLCARLRFMHDSDDRAASIADDSPAGVTLITNLALSLLPRDRRARLVTGTLLGCPMSYASEMLLA